MGSCGSKRRRQGGAGAWQGGPVDRLSGGFTDLTGSGTTGLGFGLGGGSYLNTYGVREQSVIT